MSRNLTRHGFLSLCAALASLALFPIPTWGFERREHDDITEESLFGHANKTFGDSEMSKAKKALECAVYLCLDQTRTDGQSDLDTLKSYRVRNLPSLDEIALTGIFTGSHDAYTHMGWHHTYKDLRAGNPKEDWGPHWSKRKKLLVDTVNAAFNFGAIDSFRVGVLGQYEGTRCDGFAELLYCIHVLGDFQDKIQENLKRGKYRMDLQAIPFATANANSSNRDLLWDLNEALSTICTGTEAEDEYERFAKKLESISRKARRLGTVSGKTSAESFRKNVLETRHLLKADLPRLLDKVDFFRETFPR